MASATFHVELVGVERVVASLARRARRDRWSARRLRGEIDAAAQRLLRTARVRQG